MWNFSLIIGMRRNCVSVNKNCNLSRIPSIWLLWTRRIVFESGIGNIRNNYLRTNVVAKSFMFVCVFVHSCWKNEKFSMAIQNFRKTTGQVTFWDEPDTSTFLKTFSSTPYNSSRILPAILTPSGGKHIHRPPPCHQNITMTGSLRSVNIAKIIRVINNCFFPQDCEHYDQKRHLRH